MNIPILTPLAKGLVELVYTWFFDLFNSLYQSTAIELQSTPSSFANVGGDVIGTITSISESAIMPIAAAILAYSLSKNLFELINQHNNGSDFDYFGFFKALLKTGIATYITSNCFTFVLGFFDVGAYLVSQVASTNFSFDVSAIAAGASGDTFELISALLMIILGLIIGLIVIICAAIILITIWTRLINIYILLAISPIAFATILGSGSLGQIGIGYIKNVLATALQGFIIALLLSINTSIVSAYFANLSTILDLLKAVILLVASTLTVSKSLSLAKTAVGLAG